MITECQYDQHTPYTHNSTEELLHPNIIKMALHVSLNQKLLSGLWVWSQTTTLPSP